MHTASLLCLMAAAWATGVAHAKLSVSDIMKQTHDSSNVVPNRYIIEFDSTAALSAVNGKRDSPHADIYSQMKARGLDFTVNQEYTSDLFVGAAVSLASSKGLETLAALTGVKNIFPVSLLRLPDSNSSKDSLKWPARSSSSVSHGKSSTTSPVTSITTQCTGQGRKKTCTTRTVTSGPTATSTPQGYPTTGFSVLPQIGADKVHAQGIYGKGVKVAIIDSGVDYTREPLGGCFGPECKIIGGYDFVGDDFDGSNEPVPDNDPYDNCYVHGTITAGIIGANDNMYNVTGVAPQASILAYRVYSCSGATFDSIILSAMERAYKDGADVINLSLGETTSWNESPLSVLASRLTDAGVVVTAAAGNSGQNGGLYTDSPGTGVGVLSVGATDNTIFPAQNATVSTGYGPIRYFNYQAFATGTYPLFAYTTDPSVPDDGCVVPEGTPDLAGKLVIVRRGGCSLSDKARNAYIAGATAIFVVNTPDTAPLYQNFPLINFALINNADGEYLLSQISSNSGATVTFSFNPAPLTNTDTGGLASYFSSIGPTNNVDIKPQFLAPGTNIVGIVPTAFNNFSITDGTSWSSAYGAGAAALYLSAKGSNNLNPTDVQSALQVNAKNLPTSFADSTLITVAQQGAGQLQIFDAIQASTSISPSQLQLNDTANFEPLQYLTITNTGNDRNTANYKLSHVPAGTAALFQAGLNQSNIGPLPQTSASAAVRFSDSSFSLRPGASKTVLIYFSRPSGLSPQVFPVYSGFINVASRNVNQHVPYLGIAAKMKDMPIIDGSDYYFGFNSPTIMNAAGEIQTGVTTYTLAEDDAPTVIYRLVGGTAVLLIDLISANASLGFTPEYASRKRHSAAGNTARASEVHSVPLASRKNHASATANTRFRGLRWFWWYKGVKPVNTFNKVPILGNVFETDYSPRNTENVDFAGGDYNTFSFAGTFSNGTDVPNGTYKFLLRALKITGDPAVEADYEAWTSQTFVIHR